MQCVKLQDHFLEHFFVPSSCFVTLGYRVVYYTLLDHQCLLKYQVLTTCDQFWRFHCCARILLVAFPIASILEYIKKKQDGFNMWKQQTQSKEVSQRDLHMPP